MSAEARPAATTSPAGIFNVQPCLRDPICGLLKERWRLSPLQAALLFAVVFFGGNFVCAWIDGNAFARPGLELPFTADILALVLYVFLVPVGIYLALRFYGQIESAIEAIYSRGLVAAPLEDYNRFLAALHRRYNSPGLHLAALGAAAAVFAFLTYRNETHPGKTWLNLDAGSAGVVQSLLGLVIWYCATLIIMKIAITTTALYRVFDWPVNLQPLHPDGCGGFRLFTDVAVTIALFTAVLGLAVVLFVLAGVILYHARISATPVLVTIALEVLSPLAFFTFLYRAHQAMAEAKRSMLDRIHTQFQVPFTALRDGLHHGEFDDAVGERIVNLKELHEVIEHLPEWPANTNILFQVATSVALPLLILGLQFIIDHYIR